MNGNIFNSSGIRVGVVIDNVVFGLKGQKLYDLKGSNIYKLNGDLGPVEIHREFITAAARWIFAAKL